MIRIERRGNESYDKMIRRFNKRCEKEELLKDIKKNQFYEKKSEARRREVLRILKQVEKKKYEKKSEARRREVLRILKQVEKKKKD